MPVASELTERATRDFLTEEKVREFFGNSDRITSINRTTRTYGVEWDIFTDNNENHVSIRMETNYSSWDLSEACGVLVLVTGTWKDFPSFYAHKRKLANNESQSLEEFLNAALEKLHQSFRKPASVGSVKAYLDRTKLVWTWKRANSNDITQLPSGEYVLNQTHPDIRSVVGVDGQSVFRYVSNEDYRHMSNNRGGVRNGVVMYNGRLYLEEALTPVYDSAVPFNSIVSRMLTSRVVRDYEFVLVDGERRYVNVMRRNGADAITNAPIHSYNTRIEQLIPEDKLFRMGKNDLYSKRDRAEVPFLGFELEARCDGTAVGVNKCAEDAKGFMPYELMCKSDSSIGGMGFEIVSIPATLDHWKESGLSSTLDALRSKPYNMRSYSHSSCGFHCHVSRSALSVLDLQKLERFVNNPANRPMLEKIAGRGANTYQKYNDRMFNDRKGLASYLTNDDGEEKLEGLTYFCGYNHAVALVTSYSGRGLTVKDLIYSISGMISNYISFDDLDIMLKVSPDFNRIKEDFPFFSTYTNGWANLICSGTRSTLSRRKLLPNTITTEMLSEAQKDVYIANLYRAWLTAIAKKSGKFSYIMGIAFPSWDLPTDSNNFHGSSSSWKAGILKSPAPYGRKNSREASQMVKGPVGKGQERYDVLNTRPLHTVEFRLFKGTMNPTTVMRYLEFVDALVRFVPSTSANDEGLMFQRFLTWLVGDAFNIARYEHLVSFLIEQTYIQRKSVRRKELPTVRGEDSELLSETTLKPVGFVVPEPQPLGSFTVNPQAVETPTVEGGEPASDYEYDGSEDEDEDDCGDPDCNLCNPIY